MRLHVHQWGTGPRVVLVHGGVRPENVRSLTIVEPPSAGVARGVPVVDAFGAATRAVVESDLAPVEALRRFFPVAGVPVEVPDEPHETLLKGMRQLLGARPPDEAGPPLSALRRVPDPGRLRWPQRGVPEAPEFN